MKNIGEKVKKELDSYNIEQEGNRLYLNTIHINPFIEQKSESNPLISYEPIKNEQEYKEFEQILNDLKVFKDKYSIYASYDVSGYEYWKEQSLNHYNNYISIVIVIDDVNNINESDIKNIAEDIDQFIDTLLGKLDHLLLVDVEYLY